MLFSWDDEIPYGKCLKCSSSHQAVENGPVKKTMVGRMAMQRLRTCEQYAISTRPRMEPSRLIQNISKPQGQDFVLQLTLFQYIPIIGHIVMHVYACLCIFRRCLFIMG